MVDLRDMFRRRAPKRGPQGFARSHVDITALGDNIGGMLTQPVRDAPPIARDGPVVREAPARVAEKPRSRNAGNGAAPRFANKAGYLAVHSVEKSFGSRQVVRGVSIYVRRGEAVGLLG